MFKKGFSSVARLASGTALVSMMAITSLSAETLMMPDRDGKVSEQIVVWGASDLAAGTGYTIDFGDGSPASAGVIGDGSFVNATHTYATPGVKTATLTVGAEVASVQIDIFDPAALSAAEDRQVDINMAIEDGLRRLWVDQNSRAASFPASPTTAWGSTYSNSETAFVVAAFQNQGYQLPDDPLEEPTGIYEKYIVERGINYVVQGLTTVAIGVTPQGDYPCLGLPLDGDECVGLYDRRRDINHQSYTTGVAAIALAATGALNRTIDAADVPGNLSGGFVEGRTYRDILQRMANALTWGQTDGAGCNLVGGVAQGGSSAGGWFYYFNVAGRSDGSTIGWVVLGLLDAEAAGVVVPQWVKDEFVGAMDGGINNDGSLDYQSNCNPASNNSTGTEKNGIGLQGLFFINEQSGARYDSVVNQIDSWFAPPGIGQNNWSCGLADENQGCGYTMYNNFKGLRLQGVATLPSVARPAGPGGIPANDWYAYYVDWFLANQNNPTTPAGGGWPVAMNFSPIGGIGGSGETAIAELILANVALVLPDPELFASIGLSPETQEHEIEFVTEATVTARAIADEGADPADPSDDTPVPGALVTFIVVSGPSAGTTGTGTTDVDGYVDFTYSYGGPPEGNETDNVQAFIGEVFSDIPSNLVDVVWIGPNEPPVAVCQDVARQCVAGGVTDDVTDASFDGGSSDPDGDAIAFSFDPALPLALSPAADPSVIGTLTVTDTSAATDQCVASFSVIDTLPPILDIGFIPVDGVPGRFEVNIEAADLCGSAVNYNIARLRIARCGAINNIVDGQLIDFNPNFVGGCSVNDVGGVLEIEANKLTLRVSGVDTFGNGSIGTAVLNASDVN